MGFAGLLRRKCVIRGIIFGCMVEGFMADVGVGLGLKVLGLDFVQGKFLLGGVPKEGFFKSILDFNDRVVL